MDEIHIEKIKQLLTKWNPLGDRAYKITDLDNYETESIDILFYIDKKSSVNRINTILTEVLSEAFGLIIDLTESKKYAERILKILNEK